MSDKRRTTIRNGGAAQCVSARIPFVASSLSGDFASVGNVSRLGRLPDEYRVELGEAFKHYGRDLFIVWSYETPIMWVAPTGEISIPSERYSQTTSRQIGYLPRSADPLRKD